MFAVAEFLKGFSANLSKTGREDHRANFQVTGLGFLVEINGVTLADRDTDLASIMLKIHAGGRVYIIGCRNRLGIINMDWPGDRQIFIIRV